MSASASVGCARSPSRSGRAPTPPCAPGARRAEMAARNSRKACSSPAGSIHVAPRARCPDADRHRLPAALVGLAPAGRAEGDAAGRPQPQGGDHGRGSARPPRRPGSGRRRARRARARTASSSCGRAAPLAVASPRAQRQAVAQVHALGVQSTPAQRRDHARARRRRGRASAPPRRTRARSAPRGSRSWSRPRTGARASRAAPARPARRAARSRAARPRRPRRAPRHAAARRRAARAARASARR